MVGVVLRLLAEAAIMPWRRRRSFAAHGARRRAGRPAVALRAVRRRPAQLSSSCSSAAMSSGACAASRSWTGSGQAPRSWVGSRSPPVRVGWWWIQPGRVWRGAGPARAAGCVRGVGGGRDAVAHGAGEVVDEEVVGALVAVGHPLDLLGHPLLMVGRGGPGDERLP